MERTNIISDNLLEISSSKNMCESFKFNTDNPHVKYTRGDNVVIIYPKEVV